jgi:hypothetical protein
MDRCSEYPTARTAPNLWIDPIRIGRFRCSGNSVFRVTVNNHLRNVAQCGDGKRKANRLRCRNQNDSPSRRNMACDASVKAIGRKKLAPGNLVRGMRHCSQPSLLSKASQPHPESRLDFTSRC